MFAKVEWSDVNVRTQPGCRPLNRKSTRRLLFVSATQPCGAHVVRSSLTYSCWYAGRVRGDSPSGLSGVERLSQPKRARIVTPSGPHEEVTSSPTRPYNGQIVLLILSLLIMRASLLKPVVAIDSVEIICGMYTSKARPTLSSNSGALRIPPFLCTNRCVPSFLTECVHALSGLATDFLHASHRQCQGK